MIINCEFILPSKLKVLPTGFLENSAAAGRQYAAELSSNLWPSGLGLRPKSQSPHCEVEWVQIPHWSLLRAVTLHKPHEANENMISGGDGATVL